MSTPSTIPKGQIKAVLFDFMGTCLDWHSSILSILPSALSDETKSNFALEWRQTYFDANTARIQNGELPEDIDITHRRTLLDMLDRHPDMKPLFTHEVQEKAIAAWHRQKAWPEVSEALRKLKEEHGWEIYVHANGTTRLQLDIVRSSGLRFDMLFSSQLLGFYKPAPENYHRALELLKLRPEECVTVAAHTSDLKGAKAVGMKTVYVRRWTDDIREDQEAIRRENDAYLEDMRELNKVISKL
ncbi:(S)-2-haloacid dehalogenase IVA [Melanomma pulvis-pyrius CBS 109.77]|uniref:(S)-2-haloacid dehalogenase IVA n=1 Tax=Melanomma pulvis-pyrius CBS 109.77 TaxID=1314802 RepID=A0A6A6XQW6_9PLEO|nr:(S)-2-haloacid dehalogenase IVA [Melanomma pulvis-pyrius CBS 109.77]